MSENEFDMRNEMNHEDIDLKEDFSGLTEISVRNNTSQPTQLPPKIDVSEAVAQAQLQERAQSNNDAPHDDDAHDDAPHDDEQPQLPGVPRGMPNPAMMQQRRPSFWQTLINRGLVILAIAAVGLFAWWWWSKNNSTTGPMEAAEAAVNAARRAVVEPIQKALKLPPSL